MNQPGANVSIDQKIIKLSQLRDALDAIRLHYEDLEKENCPDIPDIRAEKDTALAAGESGIETLKEEIRDWVLANGETIEFGPVKAQYSKGRRSWDTDGLNKLAEKYPEILKYRKRGDAYVSFYGL